MPPSPFSPSGQTSRLASAGSEPAGSASPTDSTGKYRWTICALLFFATTINYVDRQVLSLLAKTLETSIGWNDIQYSNITSAFTAAYAIGLLLAGSLMDRIGTRRGFAAAISLWSVAGMGHALARTPFGFGVARFALFLDNRSVYTAR